MGKYSIYFVFSKNEQTTAVHFKTAIIATEFIHTYLHDNIEHV